MKILYIVYVCNIFKIDSGGALRNTLFAKALSEIGHVDVICFSRNKVVSNIPNCDVVFSKEISDYVSPIDSVKSLIKTLVRPSNPSSYYKVFKQKEAIINEFVRKNGYDIIACRYIDVAIKCGLLKYKDRLIIDVDDNPTSVLKFKALEAHSIIEKWKKQYQSRRIGQMQGKLLESIRCSFSSNPSEMPSKRTVFLHNTTVLTRPALDLTEADPPRILFIGIFTYYPNIQGVTHFINIIFPKIKNAIPTAELRLVGDGKPDFLASLNMREGVTAVGRVDDLTAEYQNAAVVVIPIYHGSGTSIKFIEAMQMNRPVVSSPVGARGFSELCQDGVHYMLANNDEEFASKTIELLSNVQKAKEMAKRGYEIANLHFSQKRFMEIVKEKIEKTML